MKTQADIQNEVRAFTQNLVNEMRDHAIANGFVDENFSIKLRMANSPNQQISRGGIKTVKGRVTAWVSMKLGPYMGIRFHGEDAAAKRHIEYEHIENDPVIGALGATTWHKALAALIAHEVAHAIDHYRTYVMNDRIKLPDSAKEKVHDTAKLRKRDRFGHGASWQYIYAKLRKAYVNNDAYLNVVNKTTTTTKRKVSKSNKRFDVERFNRNGDRFMIYRDPMTRKVFGIARANQMGVLAFDAEGERLGQYDRAVEARDVILRNAGA